MRSLRVRLTFWFSLAVTATAGTAAWVGYAVVRQQMIDGIDFLLDAEIQELIARLGENPAAMDDAALTRALASHSEIDAATYYIQIHDENRRLVFRSHNLGDAILADLSDTGATARSIIIHDEPAREREAPYRGLHVQVATSMEQTEALLDRYERTLIVSLPALFLFSLLVGWLLSSITLRPIGAIQRAARRISASNLAERVPVPPGRDEIAALARLLNDLFARLETSFEQVKRFTADASHELKTPLSLIRLHAERLAQSPRLAPADHAAIEEQLEEIARLNQLVENLLLLARADAGGLTLKRRRQNPARFLREFAEDASALSDEAGRRFSLARNDEGEVDFDPALIRQVELNLLANALRYTPAGGAITLHSRVTDGAWELSLDDAGPGVPEEKTAAIFERFVRFAGPEDSAPSQGSGLGLAIARGIIEAHGGTIHAENRPGGGLRVIVHLPRTNASTPVCV